MICRGSTRSRMSNTGNRYLYENHLVKLRHGLIGQANLFLSLVVGHMFEILRAFDWRNFLQPIFPRSVGG